MAGPLGSRGVRARSHQLGEFTLPRERIGSAETLQMPKTLPPFPPFLPNL